MGQHFPTFPSFRDWNLRRFLMRTTILVAPENWMSSDFERRILSCLVAEVKA